MKTNRQMSESFLIAALLSVSGGLQDAYTYVARGKVFANAQTGNIVLLSQYVFQGKFFAILKYLVPLMFFALGVAVVELIHQKCQNTRKVHWRQLVLVTEMALLVWVGFLPERWNLLANSLVSFSCAMQVQAFRKVNGYAYASTMCIGNIRSGVEDVCTYFQTKNKDTLYKALHYFGVIFCFAFGAGLGSRLIEIGGIHTIWASVALLFMGFLVMFIREEEKIQKELK